MRLFAVSLVIVLGLASVAEAQAPPGGGYPQMPSKEEIEKRIKEEMDKLPTETAEIEGVKITYKAVPTDPLEIVKQSGQLPPGQNPDQAAKQFMPLARPYIEKNMAEIGSFVAEREVKFKSVKLKPGTYTFGVSVDMTDLVPVAVLISGGDLKKPIAIPLKNGAAKSPYATLKIELTTSKSSANDFVIGVGFAKILGVTGKFTLGKAEG